MWVLMFLKKSAMSVRCIIVMIFGSSLASLSGFVCVLYYVRLSVFSVFVRVLLRSILLFWLQVRFLCMGVPWWCFSLSVSHHGRDSGR